MPVIQLGSFTFEQLLDWDEIKSRRVPRQIDVADVGEVDTSSSVVKPRILTFTARVDATEKQTLRNMQESFDWQPLTEDGSRIDYFWMEELEFRFRQVEHVEKPWLSNITLVASSV